MKNCGRTPRPNGQRHCQDPEPQRDSEDIIISVEDTCRPPVLAPIGPQFTREGEELRFRIAATDPDLPNDTLSFSCESDSEVIDCENSIDPLTGLIIAATLMHPSRKLKEIDREYDLSAGCAQCGGCRWYAAIDGDYGFCFNQDSPNEGRITFEHGGCIYHSFIQELLQREE